MWHNDAICQYRSGSTVAQVMAFYIMAPGCHLSQCWLLTSEVLCHLHECNLTASAKATVLCYELDNLYIKPTAIFLRGLWVNSWVCPLPYVTYELCRWAVVPAIRLPSIPGWGHYGQLTCPQHCPTTSACIWEASSQLEAPTWLQLAVGTQLLGPHCWNNIELISQRHTATAQQNT